MNEILKPPTNYTGSKHNLIPQLIKFFPPKEEVDTFYDLFCGGLSVSMNVDYNKIVANDVLNPLVELYEILNNTENIQKEIERISSYAIQKDSQEQFNTIRKEFNQTKNPYLFFALVSSCTNNLMRFNLKGEFNQTFGKRTINDNTREKLQKYMNRMKQKDIQFKCMNFIDLLNEMKPTTMDFVYLDPPYNFLSEAGYNAYWTKQHEINLHKLLEQLTEQNVKFALSGMSIHKGIKNPFLESLSKYKIINLDFDYEKVARIKNAGESQEILVVNY